ncbi:helix-turn-helix transcriptional regulator [Acaryochloris sp. CCMEE 5410]|nr:helix-turn-helix transcriptional regulator [Acaryochloris sp. CCMEE 5410]
MGVHENSVYRLRKSQVMPRLTHETLDKICEFLDCSPGDLLIREKEDKP